MAIEAVIKLVLKGLEGQLLHVTNVLWQGWPDNDSGFSGGGRTTPDLRLGH